MNVAVVGAGAVGVTAAHDLAQRDVTVDCFERHRVAAGASGRAAGILYEAYADRRDARVAGRALERFRDFAGTGEFTFTACPYVWLASEGDDERAAAIRAAVARMRDHGVTAATLAAEALTERFPSLHADDVAVAGVAEGGGYGDPTAYVAAMADRARAAGATIHEGTPVGVRADPPRVVGDGVPARDAEGAYDAVLVAAGAHTKRLIADAGLAVPLKPYRVQALTGGPAYDGPMVYDATAGVYCRPHPRGLLAGDGTEEVEADPDDWDPDGDDRFVETAREALARRLGADLQLERAWAGLCTATPDRDPLVGELHDGVFIAAGWQGHGFMRAPAIGEAIAEQVLGSDPIPGFEPSRFDGDESFEIVEGMAIGE